MKEYFVYILASESKTLYIWVTWNIERRIYEHKNKTVEGFSKKYDCTKLVFLERFVNVEDALQTEKKLKNWIKTKGLKAYTFISADKPHLDIDILVEDSLVFEKHYKDKTVVEAWKVKLPVVSLDYLIAMKQNAGRDKDILDLKELLKLKDLWK